MRLLQYNNNGEFSLTESFGDEVPQYAILSHTWGAEEVTFRDLIDGTGQHKAGYRKIHFCGKQARRDGLRYFWVDTCCIDKSSSAELSEAINSMFYWYRRAATCYVYLSDVSVANHDQRQHTWEFDFRESRWFTRGWTLQELIAPRSVEFFSRNGKRLGDRTHLVQLIHEITGIASEALQGASLDTFSVDERFSWAAKRQTTRKEDRAYCLLGIFGVFLPPIYGERDNAFTRLEAEIAKASTGLDRQSTSLPFVQEARSNPLADLDTIRSMDTLETTLYYQGKYAEAEPICRQLWQFHESMVGEGHPNTVIAMSRLAILLYSQGKYLEAEHICWRAVQLSKRVFGEGHPHTIRSMDIFANTLYHQGKYVEPSLRAYIPGGTAAPGGIAWGGAIPYMPTKMSDPAYSPYF